MMIYFKILIKLFMNEKKKVFIIKFVVNSFRLNIKITFYLIFYTIIEFLTSFIENISMFNVLIFIKMENICDNRTSPYRKAQNVGRSRRSRPMRRSLLQNLLQDDNVSTTSTDSEWARLQGKIATANELQSQFDDDINYRKDENSRKPKMSIGTIQKKREELELVKQSMDYDEQLEYLNALIDSMEENFKTMFGEVTAKRCIAEFEEKNNRKPNPINYYQIIEDLNLRIYPYVEWADKIEKAIAQNLK